jgi:hypothetical protein
MHFTTKDNPLLLAAKGPRETLLLLPGSALGHIFNRNKSRAQQTVLCHITLSSCMVARLDRL